MADIAEKLLQAMQIVANKNLEAISFDTTIEATIEDISQADQGKYLVSNGASKFYAYSTETNYKLHEAVMVTVPEGNYDNQKIILGKKVKDNETAIPYRSPFGHIVDITSNLIAGAHERGINVNYNDIVKGCPWDISRKGFDTSEVFLGWLTAVDQAEIPIWDSGELATPYTGYTRIGLQAQFSTWLSTYNTTRGNYGLCLKVDFRHLDGADKGNFYNFYYFDSDSFYGDPYNFETYYTQEAVFDISEYSEYLIQRLTLFLYQRNNFYDVNGELVESPTDDDFSTVMPNLYVKDPFICLGYEDDESINDTAVLFTNNSLTYYKYQDETHTDSTRNISKNIKLRWIHREEMTKELHPMESVPEGYKITWYRRNIGAPSPDAFAGAHYEILGTSDASAPEDAAAVTFEIQNFEPDVNLQEDAIKVIITRKQVDSQSGTQTETIVAQSNILTFVNDQQVISQADVNQLSALGIKFEDLQRGRYSIYRRDGKLQRDIDSKQIRYVTAVFDYNEQGLYSKDLLKEAESVKWYYPIKNTMIKPYKKELQKPSESNITEDGIYGIWDASGSLEYHTIGAELSGETTTLGEGVICYQFAYTIKPTLNRTYTNNTIRLEVKKDGITYLADITMTFNVAGSSGSAYTLDILWNDEDNVIDLSSEAGRTITGQIVLYDENGVLVDIPDTANLHYNWYVASSQTEHNLLESEDILYPCISGSTLTEESPYLDLINNDDTIEYYYYDGNEFQLCDNNTPSSYTRYRLRKDNETRAQFKYKKVDNPSGNYFVLLNDDYVIYENRFNNLLGENYKKYEAQAVKYKTHSYFSVELSEDYIVTITANSWCDMNSIGIFELVLSQFGDFDLTALFPIALKSNSRYQGIDGATSVRYSTLGDPDYVRNPYQLFAASETTGGLEVVDSTTWSFWSSNPSDITFSPELSKKNVLKPLPIYIEDAPDYAVQAKIDNNIVWTQPILVYKDNYPSSTLNQWNGTDILQNDEEGTIVANGIAAGKKDVGNTFSGVMIGDWSRSDVDPVLSTNTGIYGFHQGAVSYAFKDDGTAFIGKDGHGRITFNGNTGVIESAHYGVTNGYGMKLDVDNGALYIKGSNNPNQSNNQVFLNISVPKSDTNNDLTKLMYIAKDRYYLRSRNWSDNSGVEFDLANGRLTGHDFNIQASSGNRTVALAASDSYYDYPFRVSGPEGWLYVNWDGTINGKGGSFSNVNSSYMTASNFTAQSGSLGTLRVTGNIYLDGGSIVSSQNWSYSGNTSGFSLSGNTLSAYNAQINGSIYANNGTIGGWKITSGSISSNNGSTTLGSDGTISAPFISTAYLSTGQGTIGYASGSSDSGATNLFGIVGTGGVTVRGTNISIVATGGVYLEGNDIQVFGQSLESYIKEVAGIS